MKRGLRLSLAVAAAATAVCSAQATEGYFQAGYGTVQKGVAGAGVANPEDAMSQTINPASIVDLPQMITLGATAFMPFRGYTAVGPGFVAPGGPFSGSLQSNSNFFLMPNVAYSSPIDRDTAWGVALYGNGGMNTNYPNVVNAMGGFIPGCAGVYCAGATGVDLKQMFLSASVAKRFGALTVGIAPTMAMQMFSAKGLGFFAFPTGAPAGFSYSANPWNMTNNGVDTSFGIGVRAGAELKVTDTLRIGVAGSSPMYMTPFSRYAGLFADGGRFNIPGWMTIGVAFDALPTLTLMGEYKRIFYSSVGAIANPSAGIMYGVRMGQGGGPGFGWRDVNVFTAGVEWRATRDLTLRAGYAHNTNPIRAQDVTFNILAPGVVTDHISGGASYNVSENSKLDLAVTYVPKHSVIGPEVTPNGVNWARGIDISMRQWEVSVGYSHKFGAKPTPVVAKY
ncbi:MAG: outer membrane protein transport protein [Hyphomicrobiales bacterium]|nr:outer membrane protein transport protein [Hyphomicrobiales bacterium]